MRARVLASCALLIGVIAGGLALGGCGSASGSGSHATSDPATTSARALATPVRGGTAYFALTPNSSPTYIFPLLGDADYTTANANQLITLLYRPLYWYGDQDRAAIDYRLSIGYPPVYSDGDRVVTIRLKDWRWSDGEPVSARDLIFWINLLKANKAQWANYVPGAMPDNVRSARALDPHTLQLTLTRAYSPTWFTQNELSLLTPIPLAWDRTSLSGPAPKADSGQLPDTTTGGARSVYSFLDTESKRLSSWSTSPLWSVVDGAWRLRWLGATGEVRFTPNPHYSGPDKPRLAAFVELPYTSAAAEFASLRSGSAQDAVSGASSSGAAPVTVGYVPAEDLAAASTLSARGYRLQAFYPQGLNYIVLNYHNASAGPIFSQLYFRQALARLIDQTGWIGAYYHGLAVPTYSAVPAAPANPYSDERASVDPYPYSTSGAAALLARHGWQVRAGAVDVCVRPGDDTAAGECGTGIARGAQLRATVIYPDDKAATANTLLDLQAAARRAGIALELKSETAGAVAQQMVPCTAAQADCDWQIGEYGGAWYFQPDHYPSGEEFFTAGAQGNTGSYASARMNALVAATETAPAARARTALDAYADFARTQLPVLYQPAPGTMVTLAANLRGYSPNAYNFISPEEWYFVK